MDFGGALSLLRDHKTVARAGWNGKNMYLYYVGDHQNSPYIQHIVMVTAQGDHVPWLCSQTDMLAVDWVEMSVDPPATVLSP
jgi:hypothetical protein